MATILNRGVHDQQRHNATIDHAVRIWTAAKDDYEHYTDAERMNSYMAAKDEAIMDTCEELLHDLLGIDIEIVRGSLKEGLL